jgi:4-hydroxy-2-oxoheptanedioate aldolase
MKRVNARARFEEIYAQNGTPVGTYIMSTDAAVTVAAATAGPDFIVIDREHGPNDAITTANHVRAAEANGVIPFARVLVNDPTQIQATLDVGVHGIIVPKIGNAEQAARAVAATRYQPGGRGMCPATEGARYSQGEQWLAHRESSNENVLLIPLIETREGIDNLAEIAAVDGVDYLFFGLADLSQDLDLPGGMYNPDSARELRRIWDESVEVVRAAGKRIGAPIGFGFDGVQFGTIDFDLGLMKSNLQTQLDVFRTSAAPALTR